jgi:Tol biopolymer transport system component
VKRTGLALALVLGVQPSISGDGRCVCFYSYAENLVSGDNNTQSDVFVHDRKTGVTEQVNVAADGTQGDANSFAFSKAISGDGTRVVFVSDAANLVPGDTNGAGDVFVGRSRW